MTIAFFAFVIIIFVFLVQPLIYSAIHEEIEAMEAGSTSVSLRKGLKNMVGSDTLTLEHDVMIVLGCALGLLSGYFISPYLKKVATPARKVEIVAAAATSE